MLFSRSTSFALAFAPRRIIATSSSATTKQQTARSMTATTTAPTTPLTLEEHSPSYASLLDKLRTITHLNHASSVLNYDRQVFMSQTDKTSAARGKQMATLATILHEKSTDPEIGTLIEKAMEDLNELNASCDDDKKIDEEDLKTAKRILELEKHDYNKRICIPSELAARKAKLEASANHAWVQVCVCYVCFSNITICRKCSYMICSNVCSNNLPYEHLI